MADGAKAIDVVAMVAMVAATSAAIRMDMGPNPFPLVTFALGDVARFVDGERMRLRGYPHRELLNSRCGL